MKDLHYFERTGLFMHNGNTHGCSAWKLIGQCTYRQFHEFVDRLNDWRKKKGIELLNVDEVRIYFAKFMAKQ